MGIMLSMFSPRRSYFLWLFETIGLEVLQYEMYGKSCQAGEHISVACLVKIQDEEDPIHLQSTLHFDEHLLQGQGV